MKSYTRKLFVCIIMSLLFVGLLQPLASLVPRVWGTGWLSGWSYCKSHVINSATGAGTNYDVEIVAYYGSGTDSGGNVYLNSLSRTDFGDVRFTKSDGTTLLNYWMQSYYASANATFWVQIADNLDSSPSTIFMYYGNSGATTTSSGTATFLLFDDFLGTSLNTTEWSTSGSGSVSVSNGIATITAGTGGNLYTVTSATTFGLNTRAIARAESNITGTDSASDIGFKAGSDFVTASRETDSSDPDFFLSAQVSGTATNTMSNLVWDNNWHIFYVMRNSSSSATIYIDNASYFATGTTNIPTGSLSAEADAWNSGTLANTYLDWIAVTNYVSPEPSQGSWGNVQVPLSSVTVSPSSVTVNLGQSQTLTSDVLGGRSPYSYQWFEEAPGSSTYSAILGAISSSYTFSTTTSTVTGVWNLVLQVTDGTAAAVNSTAASVTVFAAPIWTYTTGSSVESSPTVDGGMVYVGSNDYNVYCLNASTGAQIWTYTTGGVVFSSPTVASGMVFFGSYDDNVYCLNATTGAQIWTYTTGDWVRSSPTVSGGMVYIGSNDNNVYCLNATTGTLTWTYTTTGYVISSPAVAGGLVFVGSWDDNVYCLNASTGVKVWSYTTGNPIVSSPAVAGGLVYIGSIDGMVYCLNAITGTQVWAFTTVSQVESSPAVAGGLVYVGTDYGLVYCLNAITGAQVWNYTTGWGWAVVSRPAVAGGMVFVSSLNGRVYCLNAITGTEIWIHTAGWGSVWSSPAVAGGLVFFGGDDSKVYAFGAYVLVPLSGWEEDPLYTNASYVLNSGASSLYLEIDATDTSSKVAIFNLNAPKLSLSSYAYVDATVTGTNNAKILLRFFMNDGNSFDVVYWQTATTLNSTRFDLGPYAGRTVTGLVYVALMSADGTPANINITQIAFVPQVLSPSVPSSGWQEDPLYTNAPYALSSTESSLYLEIDATDTSSKVAIFNLNAPKLSLSSYTYVNATVAGTDNARILLRFFMDDGNSFDVVYWESPATLNATKLDLSPYAGRTLTGLVYVALMSADGNPGNINITRIGFEALPPTVTLSGWVEDSLYTNAPYVLDSTESSLYLELDAAYTSDEVAIFNLNAPKLSLSGYTYVGVTLTQGSDNARILLRFFMDDGNSFDVVYWESPATLNVTRFDLSPYSGRTLTGLVYVALMSADGGTSFIRITQIAFATKAIPPLVPLSNWQEDPQYTNATYVLSSSTSSLYLQLDATDTSSKVATFSLYAPKLSLSDYSYAKVTVTGTSNALVLVRFFMDDGNSFDIVRYHTGIHPIWESPVDLNGMEFDLSSYAGRTLTGLVYVGLMSADGTTANINITQIAFEHV